MRNENRNATPNSELPTPNSELFMELPFDTLGGILAIILGFGFIIFVHELGHFMVAKWVGIKCPQFAIGMGTAAMSYRKGMGLRRGSTEPAYENMVYDCLKQQGEFGPSTEGKEIRITPDQYDRANQALGLSETEYRLNWLPLGGYVKMLGQEDMDPNARSDDPRAFNSKPIWARACVISAGVVMNIIFGVIFFVIAFMAGVGFNPPIVGTIAPNSPAALTYAEGHDGDPAYRGLRTGDLITHVDDEEVRDLGDVRIEGALAGEGEVKKLSIVRLKPDGTKESLVYRIQPEVGGGGLLSFGFFHVNSLELDQVKDEDFKQAFSDVGIDVAKVGLKPQMTAISAGGKPIEQYVELLHALAAARGKPVPVTFEDSETKAQVTIELSAKPVLPLTREAGAGFTPEVLGIRPATAVNERSKVDPKSPAGRAGLKPGDVFRRVGGTDWPSAQQLVDEVKAAGRKPLRVVVLRDGKEIDQQITPDDGKIGVHLGSADSLIRTISKDSPLFELNLPGGSRIVSIDGKPVDDFTALYNALVMHAHSSPDGFDAQIGYEPAVGKEPVVSTHQIAVKDATLKDLVHAEWEPTLNTQLFSPAIKILQESNPGAALALGVHKAHQSMTQVYLTLTRLVQGTVPLSQMQGPIGITHTGSILAKRGWTYLIFFLALISVNLAVINFLPLPIVDGGHIVFLIIEKIKGSPVGPRVQTAALLAGLALIAFVFIYVTYNDILRLFA